MPTDYLALADELDREYGSMVGDTTAANAIRELVAENDAAEQRVKELTEALELATRALELATQALCAKVRRAAAALEGKEQNDG